MNCNILIVDDSPVLRSAIKKVVKLLGVEDSHIFEAGNGREALDVLEETWIDLVLLDLNMPVMNGEEFAQELRAHPELSGTAVVIVSTESNQDRLNRMRDLGVTDSLRKPFEPEDLRSMIAKKLGVTA